VAAKTAVRLVLLNQAPRAGIIMKSPFREEAARQRALIVGRHNGGGGGLPGTCTLLPSASTPSELIETAMTITKYGPDPSSGPIWTA